MRKYIKKDFNNTNVLLSFVIFGAIIPTFFVGLTLAFNLVVTGIIRLDEIPLFSAMIIYSDTMGFMLLYTLYPLLLVAAFQLRIKYLLMVLIFMIIRISLHNTELMYNKKLARIDNLTKTLNRKAFEEKNKELFNDYHRYKNNFSILLILKMLMIPTDMQKVIRY